MNPPAATGNPAQTAVAATQVTAGQMKKINPELRTLVRLLTVTMDQTLSRNMENINATLMEHKHGMDARLSAMDERYI